MKKKPTKPKPVKLKPCPFCSGESVDLTDDAIGYYVWCGSCYATGPVVSGDSRTAAEEWNRRVSEPKLGLSRAEWKQIWKSYGVFNDKLFGAGDWKRRSKCESVKRQMREVERLVNAALKRRGVR